LQPGSILFHPQRLDQKYSIAMAHELARSIYYDALDLTCPDCGAPHPGVPADGMCQQCPTPLQPVLIHERRRRPGQTLAPADLDALIRLSAGHPNILPHRSIVQYQESIYTVVEHPGQWSVLVRGQRQRSPDEALAGIVQIGRTLDYLHQRGFIPSEVGGASIESLVVVGGAADIQFADLSTCTRLLSDQHALRAQVNSAIAFLAWTLFYLATGSELSRADIQLAPPMLRTIIERAMQEEYASVQDMLTDLALLPPSTPPARSLKPTHGQATHPGQEYPHNEDAVITFTFDKEQEGRSVPIGFFLVADGMGGRDAGDLASRTVNQIVTDWIIQTKVLPDLHKASRQLTRDDTTGEMLTQAIQQANETLLHHGQTEDSDLGSTVTAALIIGDVATIANVGDSRTYLLRDGRLEQITQDHSLVARLVDAGIIEQENVRSHPQRNQIYRCLGHNPDIEVDTFTRSLRAGDVLVLCSDGLWEMVPDDEIHHIVGHARSPQKACDALIGAANQAGGRDNIAVIVVEME
ncbi:MAG TPA: hypothetical protein ENN99_10650, partial [Chloroflexi bacterium]|nr:hypothetical protein [Chloroflexota bacterium]